MSYAITYGRPAWSSPGPRRQPGKVHTQR